MKHLSELRTMIEDITKHPQKKLSEETKPVSISGDNNIIVVYAAGPVNIYGGTATTPEPNNLRTPKGEQP